MSARDEMRRHVDQLAQAQRIHVEVYNGHGHAIPYSRRDRRAVGERGIVQIREVRGISSYFTALHEVGHLCGPGRSARKLEAEANAWAYALRVAIRPPTPAVRKMIARCLQSYLDAGRRGSGLRQNMVEPPIEHEFWALLRCEPIRGETR